MFGRVGVWRLLFAASVSLASMFCASTSRLPIEACPAPSSEHPCLGCTGFDLKAQYAAAGEAVRVLPRIVRVVGEYLEAFEPSWKLLLPGENDPLRWVPMSKDRVAFGARCGAEARAYEALNREAGSP